jgi:hypothetical protein
MLRDYTIIVTCGNNSKYVELKMGCMSIRNPEVIHVDTRLTKFTIGTFIKHYSSVPTL